MKEFERKGLPTYIRHGVNVLFCGINPGRISAAKGYHYANPANLFWRGLYEGGLTPRQLRPEETACLLEYGYGITDLVARPTRSSGDLKTADFEAGREVFVRLVQTYQPRIVCFNGLTAFRHATGQLKGSVPLGLQQGCFFGTTDWPGAHAFVIPSTSGANAGFSREERLAMFGELAQILQERGWLHTESSVI